MDQATAKKHLLRQRIEVPSWGFANSGTRFGSFLQPGAARTMHEKLDDAATVHQFTGICPTVALHIPWDGTPDDDWDAVKAYADERKIEIGSINPNVFQDQCYKFGSFGNPDAAIRQKAVQAHLDCCAVAKATGSDTLSLWYADGTNYPGQDDFRARKRRFEASLSEVYAALPEGVRMLVEYKFFEPAFYHTDIPDWGTSMLLCSKLGPKAQVLVDTGHHPQGANIEHIVATLLDEGKLGGFHFNSRKYADDDLTVGSIDPYELFLIFVELVKAANDSDEEVRTCASRVAYMFDQCHNLKHKIEATIQSALFCQLTYAKALLVDYAALSKAQAECDLLVAEEIMRDAFNTDVSKLLIEVREEMGIDADPIAAYRASGLKESVAKERIEKHGAVATGSGFQ